MLSIRKKWNETNAWQSSTDGALLLHSLTLEFFKFLAFHVYFGLTVVWNFAVSLIWTCSFSLWIGGFARLVNEIRFLLFCITSTVVCLVPAFYKLNQSSQCRGTKRNGGKNEWIMFFNPLTLNFNFLFQSLTRDNTIQYGEFGNSLLRWKLIEQSFLTTSLNHFLLGWSGKFALWAWDWKG